jgi:hypothetical protein
VLCAVIKTILVAPLIAKKKWNAQEMDFPLGLRLAFRSARIINWKYAFFSFSPSHIATNMGIYACALSARRFCWERERE